MIELIEQIFTAISSSKDTPTIVTIIIALGTLFITMWLRVKDADVQSVTTLSKVQNEKLLALMNQNEQLLDSVSTLQVQVQSLHNQMNAEADEHRKKLEQTYKLMDEMRVRITELEDLVRHYQTNRNYCSNFDCQMRQK